MLLKGVNKRVIVIKNPESEIFEEAYFIIKSGGVKGVFRQSKENEMVIEANRIISDYHNQQRSIIEKNGIASSIGGDISEIDSFLNGRNDNDKPEKKVNNIKTPEKNNKDNKLDEIKKAGINHSMSHLSDEEIFEDEKIFENMQNAADKYGNISGNLDFIGYGEEKIYKPAFGFISSKRIRIGKIPVPPKSFFVGVGFMSALIILVRFIEYILLQ